MSICTWRCTRSWTVSRYSATRSSRSGKSVTCTSPARRSMLNDRVRRQEHLHAAGDVAEHIGGGVAGNRCRAASRRCAADQRAAGARRRQIVDVEQTRLRRAPSHLDERPVHPVVETQRPQDQSQRLAHRDVLQLADERPLDRGIGHDAERRAAHQKEQQIADRHRLGEGQRERAVVQIGRERALVELGQGQCRQLALVRRASGQTGSRRPTPATTRQWGDTARLMFSAVDGVCSSADRTELVVRTFRSARSAISRRA